MAEQPKPATGEDGHESSSSDLTAEYDVLSRSEIKPSETTPPNEVAAAAVPQVSATAAAVASPTAAVAAATVAAATAVAASASVPATTTTPKTTPTATATPSGCPYVSGAPSCCPAFSLQCTRKPGEPRFACCIRALPPAAQDLVMYKKPINSGVAIAIIATLLTLTFCRCVPSLLWVGAYFAGWALVASLAVNFGAMAYFKYIKHTAPINLAETYLHPHVVKIWADLSPLVPSTDMIVAHVRCVLNHVPCLLAGVRDLLYCKCPMATGKAAVVAFAVRLFAALFTVEILFWIGFVLLFTAPVLYTKYSAQVDRFADAAEARVGAEITKLRNRMTKPKQQ